VLAAGTTCKTKAKSLGCVGQRELEALKLSTDSPLHLPTPLAPSIEVAVKELTFSPQPQLTALEWTVSVVWTKQVKVEVGVPDSDQDQW